MAVKFNILNELLELFGVKQNPVVAFFFAGKEELDNHTANIPHDFNQYKLIAVKKAWWDDKEWVCYGKKCVNGCFSSSYWKA